MLLVPLSGQFMKYSLQAQNISKQIYKVKDAGIIDLNQSPAFAGDLNKQSGKPFWKNPLLVLLTSLTLFPTVSIFSHFKQGNKEKSLSSTMFTNSSFIQVNTHSLTLEERLHFKDMEASFKNLESRPSDSLQSIKEKLQLKHNWDELRNKTSYRDEGARIQLHALWVNRMYDELTNPHKHMIRFDDDTFNELVSKLDNGQIIDHQFKTEVQKRALKGLAEYFTNISEDNELLQDKHRFFKPVIKILETSSDQATQESAHKLLIKLFINLKPDQQKEYVKKLTSTFLYSKQENDKFASINHIYRLHNIYPRLPEWKPFIEELKSNIVNLKNSRNIEDKALQPYFIVMYGLIKDPQILTVIEPLVSPVEKPDVQRSVAWALGNSDSQKSFTMLKKIVENPEFHPLAREMAIYSLAEYAPRFKEDVLDFLKTYAPDGNLWQQPVPGLQGNIREAVRVVIEKLLSPVQTTPDLYINRLLKTYKDKTAYADMVNRFVKGHVLLATEKQNIIDGTLIPYRSIFGKITDQDRQHKVVDGVLGNLSMFRDRVGVRTSDGELFDLMKDLEASDANGPVSSTDDIKDGSFNTFAQKSMHLVYFYLKENRPDKFAKIETLYKQAVKENRLLDKYSGEGPLEYFIRGGEAMSNAYKNHDLLYKNIFNNANNKGDGNTRSDLKRKDPELFEFLQSLEKLAD